MAPRRSAGGRRSLTDEELREQARRMDEAEAWGRREAQRLQRERGTHFIDPILDQFWKAGLESYDAGAWKVLAGKYVFDVTPRANESVDDVYDRIVSAELSDRMMSTARRALVLRSDLTRTWEDNEIVVREGDEVLCRIRPSHAIVMRDGRKIRGNFLAGWGGHWTRLADGIAERGDRYRLRADYADDDLHLLVHASVRLREARAIAYPTDVVLISDELSIRVRPVLRGRTVGYELPVAVRSDDGGVMDGHLVLDAGTGVLDIVVYNLVPDAFLTVGWTAAVFAAAELLCVERVPEPAQKGFRKRVRRDLMTESGPRGLEERVFVRSRFLHGPNLTPTPATLALGGHYVVGHRRQLQAGQSATNRALENAMTVGVVLGPGETWVKPHTRGLPLDATLSFIWDASSVPIARAT